MNLHCRPDDDEDLSSPPTSSSQTSSSVASSEEEEDFLDWTCEARRGGSLKEVDLERGSRGWASPPGSLFQVRGANYFAKKSKVPAGDWLSKPVGVDWLRSSARLDHILGRSSGNRIVKSLEQAHRSGDGLKTFLLAINLQVPGRDNHSAVFYYAVEQPIVPGSLLHKFIHGDDEFRNSRFKLINRIVKGPWIVRAAVGNHAACLLGRALTCRYWRGPNYLEIDVDIGSSTVASYILHLALGYVNSVSVDMAFLVESQSEDELPERLMGAVRIAQIDMKSAVFVEPELTGVVAPSPTTTITPGTSQEKCAMSSSPLQSNLSWKKLSRGFSLLAHTSKVAGKVDDEHTRCEKNGLE
ncbi:protein ENHANCED DISEASE RESISTANCE 2 [Selaginella moellendorffii]|nr:protein ENHANCED DISEASE RESISTANCE 2 [Selaginella moellendorffii]XP_024532333.1 protein ENHANCED DISEASE RESISTANCE 2 [Selaginella moellendorffii]|eukprot:XP_002971596.2 protein ENHANCED DISEASE RESISTANCE 2 [Selaginella moellendorffii]